MVFLIVFLEKARALRDVNALGSNHPYATINFAGQSFRTGTEEDGKNPGTQVERLIQVERCLALP